LTINFRKMIAITFVNRKQIFRRLGPGAEYFTVDGGSMACRYALGDELSNYCLAFDASTCRTSRVVKRVGRSELVLSTASALAEMTSVGIERQREQQQKPRSAQKPRLSSASSRVTSVPRPPPPSKDRQSSPHNSPLATRGHAALCDGGTTARSARCLGGWVRGGWSGPRVGGGETIVYMRVIVVTLSFDLTIEALADGPTKTVMVSVPAKTIAQSDEQRGVARTSSDIRGRTIPP